jgi:methylase of polypeptide subunit release factors
MSLPDLSRLSAAPRPTLRAFGQRLTAMGLDLAAAAPIVNAVDHLDPAFRRPARSFFLRQRADAVGLALRALMFADPITRDEARAAFGDMTDELFALGLLAATERGVVSPFSLGLVNDVYVLSDAAHAEKDAVMGFGHTSVALVRAAHLRRPMKRALEIGCGAGLAALALAGGAGTVVATDVNPRAVELARVNAAINGISNVEVRLGDRFEPVAGETFDLIVSQPPFVAEPPGVAGGSAIYGGARGDELPLSVLAGVPRHLARGGRAVLLVQWPETGDAPLEERLRTALGPGPNLLILRSPAVNVVSEATAYAAALDPTLGPAFEADVHARLAHLARVGVRELTPTFVVIERPAEQGPSGGGWTTTMPIEPLASVSLASDRIDAFLAAHALLGRDARVLAAKLRVPAGTVFAQTQVGPGAEVPSTLSARFSPEVGGKPIDLSMEHLFLVTLVHEADTVEAALPRCAEVLDVPLADARARTLAAVHDALAVGLLEVA